MTTVTGIDQVRAAGPAQDATWWRQAVVYQIYPRSFADSNGDGVGDLRGITAKVGHLRDLGVDAVWLSPFYPSALADGGYDVDDHRAVDPRIGTLDDFDALRTALHAAGIRLVVDIVPNHTSDRHAWFVEALASPPGSRSRQRYVFRRGRGPHGELPPSDWTASFGGPAWEPVGDGEWYLHLFAPEQPDLNWADDEVREDFLRTLAFWADRGVDGFRIDVAHALAKDLTEPLPSQAELDAHLGDGTHPLQDRDEVHDIYREWRRLFDRYDPPRTAVAEAWVPAHRRSRYASPQGLGQAFNFDLLEAPWDAAAFASIIDTNLALAHESGASSTWVLSNHDVVRHATRYALPPGTDLAAWLNADGTDPAPDEERGLRRARAATLLVLALPGSAYLYQGEELGLPEVADLPRDALQDPTFVRSGGTQKGRDGCRVPLPWSSHGPTLGFGDQRAHLPVPASFARFAADAEATDDSSTLALYRRALAERRRRQTGEMLEWLTDVPPTVVAFRRPGGWTSVTNFGSTPAPVPAGRVVLASGPLDGTGVPPETTVWLDQGTTQD
ncbi:glycoside hydrolase family 13 protein [Cellulomonas oligotrophica]|uniref:Alpha-glucosidase n=1 Tax=Cellulomonas oligotrophica TaxID=931536 RepID=A0A7Y9JZG0_9CELL|nr:glycoside hydrolase family 13 protein [Cellulomonas oligotrophica]NYD87842.1 alpha-glucosidase [Cellulomonas oligotrophica]GIG32951.1 glycosidase [Cellulomonas oligotrophica]